MSGDTLLALVGVVLLGVLVYIGHLGSVRDDEFRSDCLKRGGSYEFGNCELKRCAP